MLAFFADKIVTAGRQARSQAQPRFFFIPSHFEFMVHAIQDGRGARFIVGAIDEGEQRSSLTRWIAGIWQMISCRPNPDRVP